MLDMSGNEQLQSKIEKVIVSAILKPFVLIIKSDGFSDDEQAFQKIAVGKDFANQTELVFEFL